MFQKKVFTRLDLHSCLLCCSVSIEMFVIFILYLNIITTYSSLLPFNNNLIETNGILLNQNCVCVPYWQCKDDFSGLIDDGVDIMDIR